MPKAKKMGRSPNTTATEATDSRVLRALGEQHLSGNTESSRTLIAFLAGYGHPNSYTFAESVRRLKQKGLLKPSKGRFRLTKAGIDALPPSLVPPKDNADVHGRLFTILEKTINAAKLHMLWEVLKDGKAHCATELAVAAGFGHADSSSFACIIRKLTGLGLATGDKGLVQLAEFTFPYGRP